MEPVPSCLRQVKGTGGGALKHNALNASGRYDEEVVCGFPI